ncbi:MAG: helix-turn-helix transcriptional regulator [Clostridia bacterium]|nr:helix-turn-helix transcriptional regulator [Clostridia bacterium]
MKKYYKTELINKFRKENKLTVEKFCKLCNIAVSSYYKIINQQLKCRSSIVFKIARLMHIRMSDLYY